MKPSVRFCRAPRGLLHGRRGVAPDGTAARNNQQALEDRQWRRRPHRSRTLTNVAVAPDRSVRCGAPARPR